MRRMNSRSPPFAIVGLIIVCIFIAYNYWTLFSQNADLKKEIEKLQAELKIEDVKQIQFDKKNQALQNSIHDLSEKSDKLQQKLGRDDEVLKVQEENIQNKDLELSNLKNTLNKKNEIEKVLNQQLEDKEGKIEELISDSQHILTLKNDAEEALAEKDSQINQLKMQLDKIKTEIATLKTQLSERVKMSKTTKFVPGPFNLPKIEDKEPYLDKGSLNKVQNADINTKGKGSVGLQYQTGAQILPRQPSDVVRSKPSVSVAKLEKMLQESLNQIQQPQAHSVATPKGHHNAPREAHNNVLQNPPLDENDVHVDPVVNVADEPHPREDEKNAQSLLGGLGVNPVLHLPAPKDSNFNLYQNEQQNVLPEPPQKPDENLDAAVDDEENAQEDPLDDQDEEGKEIKKDLNNEDNYEYDTDPKKQPVLSNLKRHQPQFGDVLNAQQQQEEETAQRDQLNIIDDDNKANERVFEANLDKKIRNIGVRHL